MSFITQVTISIVIYFIIRVFWKSEKSLYFSSLLLLLALVVCPFFLFVDNPKGAAADAAGMGSPPPPGAAGRGAVNGRCAGGCCRRFPSGTVRRYSIK